MVRGGTGTPRSSVLKVQELNLGWVLLNKAQELTLGRVLLSKAQELTLGRVLLSIKGARTNLGEGTPRSPLLGVCILRTTTY